MAEPREISLSSRNEETREKIQQSISIFPLDEIKQHFRENVDLIEKQFATAKTLIESGKNDEAEEIWRSQIVFLDSALDFYIHEITKYGLMKMFTNTWNKTNSYFKLSITMLQAETGLKNTEDSDWFKDFINSLIEKECLMSSKKIKESFKLIGLDCTIISTLAFEGNSASGATFNRRVDELFNRRSMIVHQADREHATAKRKEISEKVVVDFIADINKITEAVHKVAYEKD